MAKYKNKKLTIDGFTFDSKKEYKRYCELKIMEAAGEIYGLELQKPFILIPAQYEKLPNGKRGKCLERAVKYIADFCYIDAKTKKIIVEDTKGFKTKDYIIKRKLMLYMCCIQIKEI